MPKLLTIATITLFAALASAQDKPLAETPITTCDTPYGGTTKWVASKPGNSAAAELHAKISKNVCTTTWFLNVRSKDNPPKRLVIAEREDRPTDNDWTQENSFEINAWSQNGEMLLGSQVQAQGDWDETAPIIYDFKSDRHWIVELQPLFERLIPKDCYVVFRPLRFDSQTSIVIEAISTDTDRAEGTPPCFTTSLWTLDFEQKKLQRSPQQK